MSPLPPGEPAELAEALENEYGKLAHDAAALLRQQAETIRLAELVLDDTRAKETRGQPLEKRIRRMIDLLVWERDEQMAMMRASGHENDELRSKASAAEARRLAAEYRATRIELDKELKQRADAAEARSARLEARLAEMTANARSLESTIALLSSEPEVKALLQGLDDLRLGRVKGLAEIRRALAEEG